MRLSPGTRLHATAQCWTTRARVAAAAVCACAADTHSSPVAAGRRDGRDRGRPTDHRVGPATVPSSATTKALIGLAAAVHTTMPAAGLWRKAPMPTTPPGMGGRREWRSTEGSRSIDAVEEERGAIHTEGAQNVFWHGCDAVPCLQSTLGLLLTFWQGITRGSERTARGPTCPKHPTTVTWERGSLNGLSPLPKVRRWRPHGITLLARSSLTQCTVLPSH